MRKKSVPKASRRSAKSTDYRIARLDQDSKRAAIGPRAHIFAFTAGWPQAFSWVLSTLQAALLSATILVITRALAYLIEWIYIWIPLTSEPATFAVIATVIDWGGTLGTLLTFAVYLLNLLFDTWVAIARIVVAIAPGGRRQNGK